MRRLGWLLVTLSLAPAGAGEAVKLTGWGIDGKNLEPFLSEAKAVGFDTLIGSADDPELLARAAAAAEKHGIAIYAWLSPLGGLERRWQAAWPDRPMPWQRMTAEEDAACTFLSAGRNKYLVPYQWGGEPLLEHEVLLNRIACLADPDVRALLRVWLDELVAIPGLAGVAFDFFGYQNFHRCHCDRCETRFAEFVAAHPDLAPADAATVFFRDDLVACVNELADHARARRADFRTAIHVYPVYAPDPLYGNRLDVDECGQTAAWYVLWGEDKIADYTRRIVQGATEQFARQEGVPMMGYYDRPGEFPIKDAARVDLELRTMIDHGARHVQVCSSIHVVRNPAIAEVFRRWCR